MKAWCKPVKIKKRKKRIKPIVLTEFGGYSYKISEHSFNEKKTYGYKKFDNKEDFENAIYSLYEKEIIPNVKEGLCGAILTQLSDVEDETNGIYTYDRRICKVDKAVMLEIAEQLAATNPKWTRL